MSEPRVRRAEIAIEQAHVDRVYTRLGELRTQAEAMRSKGYEIGHGAGREAIFEQASMLFERDMMVFHANQTLQTLDAEYEGLVFEITIEQMKPERLFSFRWHPFAVEPGVDYSAEPTTLVVFALEEVADGVMLTVTESGFDRIPLARRAKAFSANEGGWGMMVKMIEKYVVHAP